MSLSLLLQLPQDALEHIAFHLEAPDLLSFLSSHRFLHENLGNKGAFWRNLLWQREGTSSVSSSPFFCQPDDMLMQQEEEEDDDHDCHVTKALKEQFIRAAYCQRLSNVTWRAVHATRSAPSDREGHGCCCLGQDDNLLVVTGGFTNDQRIYIKDLSQNSGDDWHQIMPTLQLPPQQQQQQQHPPHLLFAYGASLTRLNATSAVRFGGFTSGGYAHETSLVAVLTITTNTCTTNDRFTATWKLVPPTFAATNDPERMALQARYGPLFLARAYHSATLLDHRYLFVVGGMKSQPGSVLDPVCLDCETWTWILYQNDGQRLIDVGGTVAAPTSTTAAKNDGTNIVTTPTGRHGHSVVWDKYRNRLVLFGGGSGSDLLRSGRDNSEVWEFKNDHDTDATAAASPLSSSFSSTMIPPSPESFLAKIKSCQWRLIHQDQNQYSTSSNSTPGGNEEMNQDITVDANHEKNRLRPAETLNLGRCHAAHHVARDTVILLFGSGKPSTNSILAYDLQTDSFVRPKLASSATALAARSSSFILPSPRFTFGSVFIPRLGCIFVHGGYSTQYSQSIVDMALLDLTPSQLDDYNRQAAFGRAPHYARSHAPVTDQHVLALHARDHHRPNVHSLIARQVMMLRPMFFPDHDFNTSEDDDDDDEDYHVGDGDDDDDDSS